ncbi:serine protease snake-like [Anopheles ziemanni]|uniref:serine protease snake-like n=1 Tax=Anopheles ziemanni TaxID=345580 RepID=UPI00265D863F|nr:serine protease snake-like [Anopheles ziemanni]
MHLSRSRYYIVRYGGARLREAQGNQHQGQRLAVQKCNEYRKITITEQTLIPLTLYPTAIKFESNNCTNVVQLIVGGEAARYGEFPHHALLGYRKEGGSKWDFDFRCGGTLISDRHVLTAAHCFKEEEPTVVRLGEYDTTYSDHQEYQVDIQQGGIRKHPEYKNSRSYHDIALVKLANKVVFSKFIRPACLWDTEYRNTSRYIATGFGYNETLSGVLSTKMMKVQLDEFPVESCVESFKFNPRFRAGIQDGQLCVGSIVEGRDTCQGDSGGPLQTVTSPNTCMYHIVGITSTGSACGIGQAKAIYTKVSYYIDWIEDNVWGSNAF